MSGMQRSRSQKQDALAALFQTDIRRVRELGRGRAVRNLRSGFDRAWRFHHAHRPIGTTGYRRANVRHRIVDVSELADFIERISDFLADRSIVRAAAREATRCASIPSVSGAQAGGSPKWRRCAANVDKQTRLGHGCKHSRYFRDTKLLAGSQHRSAEWSAACYFASPTMRAVEQ